MDIICNGMIGGMSLSARRAWIEILYVLYGIGYIAVALRKESVDRNILSKGVDYMAS